MATRTASSTDREPGGRRRSPSVQLVGRSLRLRLGGTPSARSAAKYDVHLNGLAGITPPSLDAPNSFYDLAATVETSRFQLTARA